MLCDTGPLVAVLDADDAYHEVSAAVVAALPAVPLRTTWACITESMYLLYRAAGHAGQEKLWSLLDRRVVEVVAADSQTLPRIKQIMAKYYDSPMDFADASLVIAAETLNDRRIFTLDQHFRAYLIHDQFPFEIVP